MLSTTGKHHPEGVELDVRDWCHRISCTLLYLGDVYRLYLPFCSLVVGESIGAARIFDFLERREAESDWVRLRRMKIIQRTIYKTSYLIFSPGPVWISILRLTHDCLQFIETITNRGRGNRLQRRKMSLEARSSNAASTIFSGSN